MFCCCCFSAIFAIFCCCCFQDAATAAAYAAAAAFAIADITFDAAFRYATPLIRAIDTLRFTIMLFAAAKMLCCAIEVAFAVTLMIIISRYATLLITLRFFFRR